MNKFEKELNETKFPWIKKIGEYLLSREDIQENLAKENKSLDEMSKYILSQAKSKAQSGCACLDDEEVYGMAVHYYDEDNLKVTTTKEKVKVETEVKLEVKAEVKEIKKEVKKESKKKKEIDENQMSLFDLLGD